MLISPNLRSLTIYVKGLDVNLVFRHVPYYFTYIYDQ